MKIDTKSSIAWLFIIIIFPFIVSCERSNSNENNNSNILNSINAIEIELNGLKSQNEQFLENYKAIENRISKIETDQFVANYNIQHKYKSAILVPGTTTYNVLQTDIGSITVSIQDIQPYANGSQVNLIIMNGTGYSFRQPKAKFRWGKYSKEGSPDFEKSKSRVISIEPAIISTGRYSQIMIRLDGYPPSELDYVEISEFNWESITL